MTLPLNREIVVIRIFNASRKLVFDEQRDGHLQSGMEIGMRETFDRLAALLHSIR
ncbi:hypothetical protein IFO70_30780 [Phormidium tenue FACHB-886]|nr:hypothetical protein [Phormidium tenue FACHB-886]